MIDREAIGERLYPFLDGGFHDCAVPSCDCATAFSNLGDHAADLFEFGNAKPRVWPPRTQAQARRDERLFRIEGNAVLVAVMPRAPAPFPRRCPSALRPEVNQHQMVVGAARDDIEALRRRLFRQRLGILDDVSSHKP